MTAPFVPPTTFATQEANVVVQNFNFEKINEFNRRIEICSACDKIQNTNGVPTCSLTQMPAASVVESSVCPLEKW